MSTDFGPWNPGIDSRLPADLLPLTTLLRHENIFESLDELKELKDFSGLSLTQLATFRPQRLAVHELLIRVSADYAVSDGNEYEDLGNNFRAIAHNIHDGYIADRFTEINDCYQHHRNLITTIAGRELDLLFSNPRKVLEAPAQGWIEKLLRKPKSVASPTQRLSSEEFLRRWKTQSATDASEIDRAVYEALGQVVGGIIIHHGKLRGDQALLLKLVTRIALNNVGSIAVGDLIHPWIRNAAEEEGYTALPRQERPIIMNVKGASAAGKSTLRPLQQQLAGRLGFRWEEFALISPDIFRKFLLDYESLGEAYKYAGMISGEELEIVDQKLDRYIASKARRREIPHLLIDRFRFDSFTAKSPEQGSNLLTRFGARVFMYFVVTPPHATVERAWYRGLQVGRYKAVDDLLDHNVEAFNGMPGLFFTWALNRDKDVFYEFLDNSVNKGMQPRTIAFGENGWLCIRDIEKLIDINRYQRLNVNARTPQEVYTDSGAFRSRRHLTFLSDCLQKLDAVECVDRETDQPILRIIDGKLDYLDADALQQSIIEKEIAEAVLRLVRRLPEVPEYRLKTPAAAQDQRMFSPRHHQTLGRL